VIISSLAPKDDPHSRFMHFLDDYQKKDGADHAEMLRYLERQGWCADVQYLPFSRRGPISFGEDRPGVRAVTLFEIEERCARIREGKQLVLVSAPCPHPKCGMTRTNALVPLLENPALKVWSHLVIDVQTAEELIERRSEGR